MERCEEILVAPVTVPTEEMTQARDVVHTDKLALIQNRTGDDIYYVFKKTEPTDTDSMILLANNGIAFWADLVPGAKLWLYHEQGTDKDIHVGRGV